MEKQKRNSEQSTTLTLLPVVGRGGQHRMVSLERVGSPGDNKLAVLATEETHPSLKPLVQCGNLV